MVDLPATAAWRHLDARDGFEVVFLRRESGGYHVEGHSTAVEEGEAWGIRYVDHTRPELGDALRPSDRPVVYRRPRGTPRSGRCGRLAGRRGAGAELAGCLDVDLEASGFTNAFPVHRLALSVGGRADAPAAYVRATDLRVERLEQTYTRLPDEGNRSRYDYASPAFDFRAVLVYDEFGLVLDYPGIAVRVA